MQKIMRKTLPLLCMFTVAVQLSGCSQNVVIQGAETLGNDASAYLKSDNGWSWGGLETTVIAVYPKTGKPLLEQNFFLDYSKIKIAPGLYAVALRVNYGNAIAFPVVRVEAKPGKTYLFTAKRVMDGVAIKAEYKETNTID
ncbi:hypothetical protein cym2001_29600 [Pseudomonas sp. CYM-20-01]|jgi:hypothetical protein|uniref:hypothetical protein n=1 Tax=Pseudomonas sp. CYM-20-01 TaxID=2870750 RepID=UPI002066C56E|nr:hypothetical protein [Pseudomonas sp. CYM-20-01]BDB19595.1 hypothetical protein cym2001_29600 [Pseudomonas sp. CYM-20-01]